MQNLLVQFTDVFDLRRAHMAITCSTLAQNNGNLPLSFFGGNYPIVLLNNIYE